MHVLMTADTVGGVWTYTRELVSGLSHRGHHVTLVSFGKLPCTHQISWMHNLRNVEYRPTPFSLEWMQGCEEDIDCSLQYVVDLIHEVKPDVLHFNQFAYGAIDTAIPRIVVAHSDVISWWQAVHGQQPPDTEWMTWYRQLVTSGLNAADRVIAPSEWMRTRIEDNYGGGGRCLVIYNGRSPGIFDSHLEKNNHVVSVGRVWDQAKQVSLLAERAHAVPVVIVGSQEHPEKIASGYTAGTAVPGITFCGAQSEQEILTLFAHASIYAATSRYEPFGLAPVEAALSRCALVANDIPTFREVWGEAAYYFRANDADSLAEAIRALSSDDRLRKDYGERAYDCARSKYSAERMLDAYEHVYGALVSQEAAA